MNFNRDKKGLSEIVTSILIILIAVAAVVVIWQVLLPLIKNPGEQSVSLADCTANPVTLSNQRCLAGGAVSVQATKLGPKAITASSITFELQSGGTPTSFPLGALVGTRVASSTNAAYASQTVVISGSYTIGTAASPCNIPEVVTVACP